MSLVTEKNISKIIIYTFIVIMTTMITLISYFYVKNTYIDFDTELEKFVNDYYTHQKALLKKEIDVVIDIINYNATKSGSTEQELKEETIRILNNISFEKDRSNYIFVYEILNMNGGDNFAKLLVNPNRLDIVGSVISSNYEDANGKKFREEFLSDIRTKGESFTQYVYKKFSSSQVNQKIAYFKLYPNWNWVIAVGIYTDDIEKDIAKKKEDLKRRVKTQIIQTVFLFILFLSIGIVLSILLSERIDDFFKEYREKVKAKSNALIELNETLEKRVSEELEKNREQEQLLVQKSRLIALGEMISNIAHQWRQPLSELSSILMNIKFKHNMDKLDKQTMEQKSKEAELVLDYMSHTIDDFRNFFMPKKDKEEFYIKDAINSVMTIVSSALEYNNIKVEIDVNDNIKLNTFINEYEQVLLNIISNAKDVLIQNNIKNPLIKIYGEEQDGFVILYIEDNGDGVKVNPKSKIFEPYFTTKGDSDGTGIGLYMSKIIIDKNMKGKLRVRNTKDGAKFVITVPK
ncbi:cache domain-containing protein [Arcobacter sp.]|uniref:cache domain-containing protein n=2 Tax=Arcobacter sp. TaxID=1872629 RepID=UPI003D0E1EEF